MKGPSRRPRPRPALASVDAAHTSDPPLCLISKRSAKAALQTVGHPTHLISSRSASDQSTAALASSLRIHQPSRVVPCLAPLSSPYMAERHRASAQPPSWTHPLIKSFRQTSPPPSLSSSYDPVKTFPLPFHPSTLLPPCF
ncbi:hypothetical protein L1887_55624 [Cichorium endivia]|nr:hypothetical protein L1887_55624 [Cichorium endivia]